jgi:two-component system chemotaxis response regulator CheB
MTVRSIRVLVAENSAATRELLVDLLESDPRISVVRAVGDGQAALEFVGKSKPDVVLMDLQMHPLDGFEATRRIMETHAVPIVICSASSGGDDAAIAFRAMEAGAIACIKKPASREQLDFERTSAHLLETVRLMAAVSPGRPRHCRRAKPHTRAALRRGPRWSESARPPADRPCCKPFWGNCPRTILRRS